jgi:hypothetical protein
MMQRELQRGAGEGNTVASAHRRDAVDPLDDLGRRRLIIVGRAGNSPGRQDPGIERTADDDGDVPRDAERQEAIERRLLEQRVAAGEEEAVEITGLGETLAGLPFIDADADRPDRLLLAR